MRIKTALLLCGAAALTALAPVAASAQSVFSFSIGSGYGGGYQAYYPTYGYSNQYGYGGYGGYGSAGGHLRGARSMQGGYGGYSGYGGYANPRTTGYGRYIDGVYVGGARGAGVRAPAGRGSR